MKKIILGLIVLVFVSCGNTDGEDRVLNDSLVFNEKEEVYSFEEELYFKNRVLVDSLVFNEKEESYYYDYEPFNGIMIDYYSNNRIDIKYEIKLKNGKRNGLCKWWYENGQLSNENNYKDGKKQGLCKWWYENGQLRSEGNHKDGKPDGLYKWWHENGQLKSEGNLIDEKPDGLHKSWLVNGQLVFEGDYKDGVLLNAICWDVDGNQIDCKTFKRYKVE